MLKIRDIMCKKVVTIKRESSILDAVILLSERHVGSIVVIDDEQKCVGIFTERDAIRIVAQKFPVEQPLDKVMSKNVVTVGFEESFNEAKRLLLTHNIRHLPVTDQTGKVIGLFSLRAFLDEIHGIKTPLPTAT
jgi:CBS domain-containing protein